MRALITDSGIMASATENTSCVDEIQDLLTVVDTLIYSVWAAQLD